jgi:hypothetical protein
MDTLKITLFRNQFCLPLSQNKFYQFSDLFEYFGKRLQASSCLLRMK